MDELAYISRRRCRRRPSVRPSVSPRHEAGSFLSSLTSVHVGGTQVAHPTGGWSVDIFAAERHVQNKRKKEIWVSLSRRAQIPHSTRTKVHGSAPLHHTIPQTCTTLLYNLLLLTYYGDKDAVCFKSRMFCFSCSAVLLPETYGIPYHLVHIMPPCKQEAKDDAKLASSILYTLPY